MEPIRMVDLVNQHNKLRNELNAAINRVINDAAFIHGNEVNSFEEALSDYLDKSHVISCANGTDALKIALMALELPRGSEIIMPSFTFVAPAEVAVLLGLKPVFVDVNPYTFNMNAEQLESCINKNTKVILPVHLFGQCCDMENILKIARKHDLFVIEDNAQALGAEYTFSDGSVKKAGTMGDIGTTSFFPAKNLGCMGDGGAIFTSDKKLADHIRILKNHGQDTTHYHYEKIGLNSRLDGLQAAILNVKLPLLDNFNKKRSKVANYYDIAFQNNQQIALPFRDLQSTHIFHQYTIGVPAEKRSQLQEYLNEKGIPSKIYYPFPLHKHPAYQDVCGVSDDGLEKTEMLAESVISLPIHTEMEDDQLNYITHTINEYFTK